jgi:fluoride exporter
MGLKFAYLAIGGLGGTFCRYFLSTGVQRFVPSTFPFGTLTVNLVGCFAAGAFASYGAGRLNDEMLKALFLTGFCGAFTTFSAFTLETSTLLGQGAFVRAFLNVVMSVVAGLLCFQGGVLLGSRA